MCRIQQGGTVGRAGVAENKPFWPKIPYLSPCFNGYYSIQLRPYLLGITSINNGHWSKCNVWYKGGRIFLDELPADYKGRSMKTMRAIECGITCGIDD